MASLRAIGLSLALAAGLVAGCGDDDEESTDGEDTAAAEPRHGLTAEQASQVLAKIGDETITVGEFAQRLADQSPYLRARYNSPERRREFLENMIRFELLAQEAERRGLDELPEVEKLRKQMMIQQLMREQFEDRIQLDDVTDAEVEAYYEEHRDEFHKPTQVRASHIRFTDRAKGERVLAQILAAADDVDLFRRLTEEHNTDEATQGARRGDLRFFSEDGSRGEGQPDIPAPVAEAAFALERIGGVHRSLVEVDGAFHIVKLTGRRAALHRTLEEASRPIRNRIWREKRETAVEELVTRLRREANVEENPSVLADVRIDAPESVADMPPGSDPHALIHGAETGGAQ